jgi:AsmA protein
LPDAPTKSGWSTAKLIPVTRLKALDLIADISFGQLTLSKLPIQNAALKANSQGGLLTLETLSVAIYKGHFAANGSLDARPMLPVVNLQTRINNVPVEKILQARGKNRRSMAC